MQLLAGNNRMTDIQAALGRSQLSKLAFFKKRRKEIVNIYNNEFHNNPNVIIPHEESGLDTCFHLYVLQLDYNKIGKSRKQVMEELKQRGIGTQVHYIPVNSQPYYVNKYGDYKNGDYPITESYYNKCLSIPLYPMMSNEEVEYVCKTIISITRGCL